jgi:hypothetical protein
MATETDFSLDRSRLAAIAADYRDSYRRANPFPHVVLEDFLPPLVLDNVLSEFPRAGSEGWFHFDSPFEKKLATVDDDLMGPATRMLLAELNSATMVDFLRDLTGVEGLVPDPHFVGGGLHQIEPGGFLEVHADFNLHPLTGLYRRLNLLLYLNHEWNPAWQGALELWDRTMNGPMVTVAPQFNRCVIFSTSDHSLHGHPHPLSCPQGTTRKSIALYFYARTPDPTDESSAAHNTLFQRTESPIVDPAGGSHRGDSASRRLARELLPPVVIRMLHRLRTSHTSSPSGP